MVGHLDMFDIVDLIGRYADLPKISSITNISAKSYYEHAEAIRQYCKPEFLKEAKEYPKFGAWCEYISRFPTCSIAPHPSELSGVASVNLETTTTLAPSSGLQFSGPIFRNLSGCYDDYFCGRSWNAGLFYIIYGILFALLCSAGLLLNLACVVGFNKATNRCGATLYFTVIALLDCLYLALKLVLKVSVHLSGANLDVQTKVYAQRAAHIVPIAVPFIVFCEVASVWLMVCLLTERYLYLRRGYFSKSVTSLQRHVRIISAVLLLSFCYIIPRFFEYQSVENPEIPNGYKVVFTAVGSSTIYRSLIDYLLNIPLEMFLPYLAVGMLTSMAVSKMVDLGSSKWKTVARLCSYSTYCCCGDDFANCYPTAKAQKVRNGKVIEVSDPELPTSSTSNVFNEATLSAFDEKSLPKLSTTMDGHQVFYFGIPFEKRSDLMPFYFLVPPPRQTLKETANVVITVCLGFLLLITKIPRLILLALELEKYVDLNPVYTDMTVECLAVIFIVLKSMIYLMFGVHFRHALTGLCCCACLYAPVIHGNGTTTNGSARNDPVGYEIEIEAESAGVEDEDKGSGMKSGEVGAEGDKLATERC